MANGFWGCGAASAEKQQNTTRVIVPGWLANSDATVPIGRLADRYGRERVMYPGVALTLIGAIFVTLGSGYLAVTIGTFLVGIGWAAANVASTALIADLSETVHRGRAIGVSDSGAGMMTVLAAVVTGPLVECTSLPAAGLAAASVALVPLLLLAHAKIVERRVRAD